jgi:hypothetical protein
MLTAETVNARLSYNPISGVFTWIDGSYRGKVAGYTNGYGYIMIRLEGKQYPAHRLAWLITHGELPPAQLDHRDRNRANNAITNLRLATASQNGVNKLATKPSGLPRGVYFQKGLATKYTALIRVNGKRVYLGTYDTADLAHAAYVSAARKHHGEFAIA